MDVRCLAFGFVFIILGIAVALGKVHTHIDSWKTMTEEEKNAVRIGPLCRNVGVVISLCGIIFLVSGLWESFRVNWFIWTMIAWFVVCGIDVWRISKSERYLNTGDSDQEKYIRAK